MTARHTIFDRDLLRRRRARAAEKFSAHSFLYDRVAEDAATRLMDIQRTFALGVDLHASTGGFARRLKTTAPGKIARLVAMDSTIGMVRAAPAPRLVADAEALPLADASSLSACLACTQ